MNRISAASALVLRAAQVCSKQIASKQIAPAVASKAVEALFSRSFHSSVMVADANSSELVLEPTRKYKAGLATRELWHEAWMYEEKVGTPEDPIVVPSLEGQRIIGVTDPEDDTIVVWGLVGENDPPRQLIEGGDYFVCKKVDYIRKVGDVLEEIEAAKAAALPK
uniref:Uncharacterized protein n=1 Tax=Polytomella parva TaxID=51329 RepID=A0A6U0WT60_9CHLO|mmetsp:Transcript_28663/g.52687  ORF Transcript_28663/g.52687 Transcript_28663/m.52687 type:complete len:165 (+) Transcript_28663:61-555(+)|eukprot:CAMPEP_0175049310 /NCGR_PEP_ID=MMETSP0052_2-20121109/6664_1 /TAXON_ID=51329 ORGANISM="Polytomella parva, Strain SAG 63-3" /NCGR_SAMPLE_ID=MMETSP0052_2 /ASSEMBLY_ACC=CAM_ASM_000194 /LENGTH=164 /DNA_ID=CAMNT_0016313451 /DNA_START=77 /DNA_END=571 /DNA_ORIENTATION=-